MVEVTIKAGKFAEKMKDNFVDIRAFTEHSLKEVWDNPEDEIWSSYKCLN